MWRAILAIILLALAAPASAAWMEATSRHFVVYADASDGEVRDLATALEQFDAVVRLFHSLPDAPDAHSNRVTVYVTANISVVQRLCGQCGDVAGFYVGRASGSVAYTPARSSGRGEGDLKPRVVLFHEYAHHFLLGNSKIAYPAWFAEGYAELLSTMRADAKGFTIGAPANHRANGLFSIDLPIERLFASAGDKPLRGEEVEALYGRGWLLTHYLIFGRTRPGQLNRYLALFNAGTPNLEAARLAFGDLKVLDHEMDRYLRSPQLSAMVLTAARIAAPVITVRTLSPGERALIDERMISDRGVDLGRAKALYARASAAAVNDAGDAVAQGWLAEMAYDAGEDAAASAAAERALAVHTNDAQALLYKARVELRRLQQAGGDSKAWAAARAMIARANRQDPDNAEPLMLYYGSFEMEGRPPPKLAVAGLYRAQELVPQDEDLRWTAAKQQIEDGNLPGAKQLLRPLAFSPHAGADNPATKLLTALEGASSDEEVRAAVAAEAAKAEKVQGKTGR